MKKKIKDPLGDRLKSIENKYRLYLPRKELICIRLDGVHFHSTTRNLDKPFDEQLSFYFERTLEHLCANIQGCKLGYQQSDEITLILSDLDKPDSEQWFGGNIQKIASVSASMATSEFNKQLHIAGEVRLSNALFDSRVFSLPMNELENLIVWRFKDCVRNSIQGLAQVNIPHKQLQGVSALKQKQMLFDKEIDWNDWPEAYKYGKLAYKVQKLLTNPSGQEYTRGVWNIESLDLTKVNIRDLSGL